MLKVSNYNVFNFENALRGARNPLCSWSKNDSCCDEDGKFVLGKDDLNLARRLCKAGSDHRKFLRQIFVSVDILAPLYWWKEFDTYKIGTTSNSTSTMHTIHKNKITMENLSNDYLDEKEKLILSKLLEHIEKMRVLFLETKNKDYWYKIIQLLPSSFNQLRTCTMSYENLINIHFSRRNHKLDEWKLLCTWIESLPYFADIVLE